MENMVLSIEIAHSSKNAFMITFTHKIGTSRKKKYLKTPRLLWNAMAKKA